MRWVRWATYLWPGLPQLWFEGAWSALALAIGFSLLLNLLLVASLVWVDLLEPAVLSWGWLALGLAWVVSIVVMGWGNKSQSTPARLVTQEDLFRRALGEYLRGAWFEAESLCGQIIERHPRDVDARLMLATVLRRTKRYQDARQQIAELERIELAARWQAEIEQEKQLLGDALRTVVAEAKLPQASNAEDPDVRISRAA
jgi:hypothetical protein